MSQDPEPTRKEREFNAHRCAILNAAVRLFAENGYHQTTMQSIAEAADFSVGYLYKHFSGKEEMYNEMVNFHMDRLDEIIAEAQDGDLSPLERLHRSLVCAADHFNRHRDFMRIYHLEIGGRFAETLERKTAHHEEMVRTLREAVEAGELRPTDPELLGAVMQGAIRELFKTMAERSGERPFDDLPNLIFRLLIDPLRS